MNIFTETKHEIIQKLMFYQRFSCSKANKIFTFIRNLFFFCHSVKSTRFTRRLRSKVSDVFLWSFVHKCWHSICFGFFSFLYFYFMLLSLFFAELKRKRERGKNSIRGISSSPMMTIIRYDCYSLIQSPQNHYFKLHSVVVRQIRLVC